MTCFNDLDFITIFQVPEFISLCSALKSMYLRNARFIISLEFFSMKFRPTIRTRKLWNILGLFNVIRKLIVSLVT